MNEPLPADPESATVHQNLANADKLAGMPQEGHGNTSAVGTEAPGGTETHHPVPTALGLNAAAIVSLAMIVFLAIVVWKGGVRAITGGLDRQIAAIRKQLDDARALRAEAEALRDEYARKIADAEGSARDMIAHAEAEAEALVAKARTDAAELVERRGRMAEDKIAAAERQALAEVRAKAADAAARAAAALLQGRLDAGADKALVDRTIAGLGRPH
jgi:F-type H+-transporting ATPase subunit b